MSKLFGIIGNPVEHSLSPVLQNEAYHLNGIDAHFQAFQVAHEDLERAVHGMKALGIEGFIVTVPFKAEIIPYLDEIDAVAKQMNAVNVVERVNGKYVGYNFDGRAWLDGLLEDLNKEALTDEKVLIIGAGGAAQSIYYTLSQFPDVHIQLANRTKKKAEALKTLAPEHHFTTVVSLEEAEKNQAQYDIIVQTTSIGMWPKVTQSPIELRQLKKDTFVSDIIYNPGETKIMKQARLLGAKTQNGMKMLASQNALTIERWTGQKVSVEKMMKTLEKVLYSK